MFLTIVLFTAAALSLAPQGADAGAAGGRAEQGPAEIGPAAALKLIPAKYRRAIGEQLELAGENRSELLAAMKRCEPEHREGLAFLLANMPERDLKTLKAEFLLSNVALAYKARDEAPWGGEIPDEIFLNYVLPYASLNERRDDWRRDFHERFMPIAKQCGNPSEALGKLNVEVFKQLKVRYHKTKRRKPHQSPYESTEIGFASCTGLAILLVDACRAVGVPARVVGTPLWTNKSGNHTWVEIWDRQWHFIGAAEPGRLNHTWFVGRAAAADAGKPIHRIYAAAFERTGVSFPMVWARNDRSVPAEDVTCFYTGRRPVKFRVLDGGGKPAKAELTIRRGVTIVACDIVEGEAMFELAAGESYEVHARTPDGKREVKESVRVAEGDSEPVVISLGD